MLKENEEKCWQEMAAVEKKFEEQMAQQALEVEAEVAAGMQLTKKRLTKDGRLKIVKRQMLPESHPLVLEHKRKAKAARHELA